MRILLLAVALPLSLAAVLVAGSAKADGAFITVKDGSGQAVGTRAAVAAFTAGTPQTSSSGNPANPIASTGYGPSTFEIDGPTNMVDYFNHDVLGAPTGIITVEFTKPNAKGEEVVTSVGTFIGGVISSASLSFDATGLHGLYAFSFSDVQYGTPTSTSTAMDRRASGTPPPRRPEVAIPVITRSMASKVGRPVGLAPLNVDAAYLTLTPTAGSATPLIQTGTLKTATLSADVKVVQNRLTGTVRTFYGPFSITRTHATTPAFQPPSAVWPTATLSFVHTNTDGTTTPVLHFAMLQTSVASDQASVSGGVSTETASFSFTGIAGYDDLVR